MSHDDVSTKFGYSCSVSNVELPKVQTSDNSLPISFDIDPDKITRDKLISQNMQNPSISFGFPAISTSSFDTINNSMASTNQCDTLSNESMNSTNLRETRRVHLSPPPPPIGYFRRPSFPLYYPSQSHSFKKSPYKRPRSSPLYLPNDKDYYPSIAQSYHRRRRSYTPPFKDYKQNYSKADHLQPPNIINEIWSIPREVCVFHSKHYFLLVNIEFLI